MSNLGWRLRAAKGPRAFAFEVLIVVVGVLIALGAQQLVEDWTWRERVAAAEQRLKDEAHDNVFALLEQIVVKPCVDAQLELLDAKLRAPGPWTGAETYPSMLGPIVIRTPWRSLPTGLWTTLGAEGTALKFEPERAMRTESYYNQLQTLVTFLEKSSARRTELDYLARPAELTADTRSTLLQTIAAMRFENGAQVIVSIQLLAKLHELGRLKSMAALEEDVEQARSAPLGTIGMCADRGLPLGDWKAALRQQIAENRAHEMRSGNLPI